MKQYEKPIIDINLVDIDDILLISPIATAKFDDWTVGEVEDFSAWRNN